LPNLTEMNRRLGIRHIAAHCSFGEASLAVPTAHDSNTVILKPVILKPCKKTLPKAR
jgi:hypothetical protein